MEINENDIDFTSLLIKRYTLYKLTDLEAMVLLVSDKILNRGEYILLTRDILSKHMASTKEEIDIALNNLFKKGIIELFNNDNNYYSSIDKFKKRLFSDLIKDIKLGKEGDLSNTSSNLYTYLEQLNNRTLSVIERDYVTNWLKSGVEEKEIKEACVKSKTKNGFISFKKADGYILDLIRSLSRRQLGTSTVDEKREINNAKLVLDAWNEDE